MNIQSKATKYKCEETLRNNEKYTHKLLLGTSDPSAQSESRYWNLPNNLLNIIIYLKSSLNYQHQTMHFTCIERVWSEILQETFAQNNGT